MKFLAGLLLLVSTSVYAGRLTPAQMQSDFDQLVSMMESGYGPLYYKKKMGIDLQSLRTKYAELIASTQSNGEFYYLVRAFIAEFKDSHFGAVIPTTHMSSLGFSTDLVDGKVLIDMIDRKKLPESTFNFQKGDEIVSLDGKDTRQVLDELERYINSGFEKTRRRSAGLAFSSRSGMSFPTPRGEAKLQIRRGTSAVIDGVNLKWEESGIPLDEIDALPQVDAIKSADALATRQNFDLVSIADEWDLLLGKKTTANNTEKSFRCSGSTRISIPKDATMIMQSPFVAYYHPTAKGNVGYLRIPHYLPRNEQTGKDEFELRFKQYEYAIQILEKNTVGLIIDQDHNCGGSVEWLERSLGLFMGKDYSPMMFQLLANKQEYLEFLDWMKEMDPFTLEYQNLLRVADLVKTTWLKGTEYMTTQTTITGAESLSPNAIRYTKPIVMLIDEMSGSGGDAFPSMMKGYGRAKLFGTRTMGAGGHVVEQPPLNYSRISVRMTKSLFYRPDGVAVENNGAEPDYSYSPTRDDFIYGYRDYQKAYLDALLGLI